MIQLRNGMHTHTGSLSTDTCHPGDVGHALATFLDYYDNNRYHADLEAYPGLYDATADRNAPFWESEEGQDWLESAYAGIQNLLPDGYYIGAHPGDGADIGIWQDEVE